MASRRRKLVTSEKSGSVEGALRRRRRSSEDREVPSRKKATKKKAQIRRRKQVDELVAPMISRNPIRQRTREAQGYTHVSALIHDCVRAMAISEHLSTPHMSEAIYEGRALTFAQGHAIQDHITQRLVTNCPEKVYGDWKCACGALEPQGTYEDVASMCCEQCGGAPRHYQELEVRNEELKLVGHVDLRLMEMDYLHLAEVKSMTDVGGQFSQLRRPMPDHIIQIVFYWWMAKEQGLPLWDSVSVIYANKNFMMGNPYKEFILTPSSLVDRLDDYMEEARDIAKYRETRALGDIPMRTQCASITSPNAKKCQFANTCFNMDT